MGSDPKSLSDTLKSLGVSLGTRNLPVKPQPKIHQNGYGIEKVVNGFDFTTEFGQTFIFEGKYPRDYYHGVVPLCENCQLEVLSAWSSATRMTDPDIRNVVFLDTETTGLMGGTGTYAFLVGIGFRSDEGFRLVQFFMRDPSLERALLAALQQWLNTFDVVVTFNGKTFDLPLLNNRYTMNGLPSPLSRFEHVDVLHLARKLWRDRLPSRALGDLEKEIVRFFRTGEDIPGWMIPQLYFDYIRSGDARPLGGVFYHNAIDILTLASLFNHTSTLLTDPIHQAVHSGLDMAAIARLYEELGWFDRAAALYEASLGQGLPEEFFFKTIDRYALLCRKHGEWQQAVRLWHKAAEHGYWSACVELAKYYEHQERNYEEALRWTQEAIALLPNFFRFGYTRRAQEDTLNRRMARLQRKMGIF